MNAVDMITIVYTMAQTALLAMIRYWLYKDSLRIPFKRMCIILAAIPGCAAALWICTGGIAGMTFNEYRAILLAFMFTLSCIMIRVPFAKHSYSYTFLLVYDVVLETTASYVQTCVQPGEHGLVFVLTAAILLLVSFIPATRYLKRMIDKLSALTNDRIWLWLCAISYTFVFLNLLLTFPWPAEVSLRALVSRYLMLVGVIAVYAATTRAMQTMSEAAQAKLELIVTQRQVAIQESHYMRLVAQMDEVRRMRHDLRHHRAAIAALVQSGDMSALSEYINENDAIDNAVPISGNLAADSILLYFMDAAKTLNVQLDIDLTLSAELPLSTPDLCVVLGNLLENAVEAQAYVAPERRYIRVSARGDATSFTLAVDNRFDGALIDENGAYRSRKPDGGHGLGIGSVRAVCLEYGGVLQIETEGDLFMAGVAIGL